MGVLHTGRGPGYCQSISKHPVIVHVQDSVHVGNKLEIYEKCSFESQGTAQHHSKQLVVFLIIHVHNYDMSAGDKLGDLVANTQLSWYHTWTCHRMFEVLMLPAEL